MASTGPKTRTFIHSFDQAADSPVTGATVDLTVADIEDAGIREILQTPCTEYGTWSVLDALLTQTGVGTSFIFKEPLGQAREVQVALSGLFGPSSPAPILSGTSTSRSSRISVTKSFKHDVLQDTIRGANHPNVSDRNYQLSRSFRALEIWM